MKKTITTAAFALLLAAGVSQAALAQDQGGRGQRGGGERQQGAQPGGGQQGGGDQQRGGGQAFQGRGRDQGPAPQAQAAPAPPQAREAPQAFAPQRQATSRADWAEGVRRQRDAQAQGQQRQDFQPLRADPRAEQPRNGGGQSFDRNPGNRDQGNRDQGNRNEGDRNRADQNRGDQNRWDNGRNGGYAGQQWQRGRFPPIYQSQQRFRIGSYRPPSGFYVRQWGFGDFLPRAWYGSQYYLSDFDYYGLPYPPPGFEWVRVGEDALLIDRFTGRIVQVVRYLFW